MIQRNTIQCVMVYDAVNALKCHATADEVYEYVYRENPTISRGTVYRNLNRLSGTGKIRKIEIPGAADRFDHRCDEHYHIKCEKCGRVFDVDMDAIPDPYKNIRNKHGFKFSGCSIVFSGICPECQKECKKVNK